MRPIGLAEEDEKPHLTRNGSVERNESWSTFFFPPVFLVFGQCLLVLAEAGPLFGKSMIALQTEQKTRVFSCFFLFLFCFVFFCFGRFWCALLVHRSCFSFCAAPLFGRFVSQFQTVFLVIFRRPLVFFCALSCAPLAPSAPYRFFYFVFTELD